MFLANSEGKKFPLFIVFKSKPSKNTEAQALNVLTLHDFGRVLWREIEESRDANDVQVYGKSTAWWNTAMIIEWMQFIVGNRTTASEPILLLFDSFSGHWTAEFQA
uniref:AlNc14C31G2904 protein n=1 Tax=Albugo laibachii Nc14 TaxID=890382 RepID=F0W7V4_9STRA|nr:AlNc14C31G2904 [Albugo laibachii Nc14]|eukprot:CCA17206.1 AlNc14C31G2904 [Albugo laibachii Nc14]